MAGDSFAAILGAAQRGDEDAFRLLFRSVQPRLLRYLAVSAGGAAEDVAADTWVSVVRGLGRFVGDEPAFEAWVFTIARARLRDEQRRSYRRPAPMGSGQLLAGSAAGGLDPADCAVEAAGTAAVLALIATLPPDQADAVLLRHVVGFDVARTARVLGKRPGAVRVASHRGLARLRALLDVETGARRATAVTNGALPAIGRST